MAPARVNLTVTANVRSQKVRVLMASLTVKSNVVPSTPERFDVNWVQAFRFDAHAFRRVAHYHTQRDNDQEKEYPGVKHYVSPADGMHTQGDKWQY